MKRFELSYYDLDGKRKLHLFNASGMETARMFSKQFCERFGFTPANLVAF